MIAGKCRVWLLIVLLVVALPHPGSARRLLSVDLGYVTTSSDNYGSGFTYGLTITEGVGTIGFGIAARSFSNSIYYDTEVPSGGGTKVFKYKEDLSDFYITIMATYSRTYGAGTATLLAGLGPQVHFVAGTKEYQTERYSERSRDFRLGVGFLLRYEHRFYALGNLALVVSAQYSWAEEGREVSPWDAYSPPPESLSLPAITAGFAFPF
jgi:hypothetical protein